MKPVDLKTKIQTLRDRLAENLVEREVAIRMALLSALAGEHLLLLGPPGTAKSLLARRLRSAFAGASYFERLLTRFTVPEELFGPLSIKGLEEDRYERLIEAYLPTASVAFLDEIFKANSAILNALLTLLNEREFDNGNKRILAPIVAVVGASNELPEGEELDALFDRFLLRLHVPAVSKAGFPLLLGLRGNSFVEPPEELKLSLAEVRAVQSESEKVDVPPDVLSLLNELREWCLAEGLKVSDRRWRKIVKLLQVAAYTNGRMRVSVWEAWLLQHCIWEKPETREQIYKWYAARVGASAALNTNNLTRIVVALEARLKTAQDSRSQARDEQGRLLYKGSDGRLWANIKGPQQTRKEENLFLAPEGAEGQNRYGDYVSISDRTDNAKGYTINELDELRVEGSAFSEWKERLAYLAAPSNWLYGEEDLPPALEPTRYHRDFIEGRLGEVAGHTRKVSDYLTKLGEHIQSLEDEIRSHLWVTSDFVGPAAHVLHTTKAETEALLARLDAVKVGFQELPLEADQFDIGTMN